MSKEEMLDFTEKLIKTALENKHPKSSFLHNYTEVQGARLLRHANAQLVKGFESASKEAFKQYLSDLETGVDTFASLYSYRTYRVCQKFYEEERDLYNDLISEFFSYAVFGGHLVDVIMGKDRSEHDLEIDFRTMQVVTKGDQ
jgi:hypothetical protein